MGRKGGTSGREGIVQRELLGGFRFGQPWFGLGSLLFWAHASFKWARDWFLYIDAFHSVMENS